jgi:hypothetical protein
MMQLYLSRVARISLLHSCTGMGADASTCSGEAMVFSSLTAASVLLRAVPFQVLPGGTWLVAGLVAGLVAVLGLPSGKSFYLRLLLSLRLPLASPLQLLSAWSLRIAFCCSLGCGQNRSYMASDRLLPEFKSTIIFLHPAQFCKSVSIIQSIPFAIGCAIEAITSPFFMPERPLRYQSMVNCRPCLRLCYGCLMDMPLNQLEE